MRPILLVLSFLLPQTLAIGQSVDSLVHEAMSGNPQLRSYGYQREAAEQRARAAGALPAPTLGIEFDQVPTSSTRVLNDAIANTLSFSQMFMLGGKLSAMSEVERRKGGVVEQSRMAFAVQLRARVTMSYYRLWLLDRQIEVQRSTLRLLDDLVRAMQPHVLTNRMRQADLLSIQAEAASEGARLEETSSRRTGLESELNALMGRGDLHTPISVDSLLPPARSVGDEPRLSERLLHENPGLLTMDRMKEMNDAMITAAGREMIPDVMVQGMIMRMPNGMVLTSGARSMEAILQSMSGVPMQKTEWMYSIMVSITLPFMPWSSERSAAKQEEMRSTNLSIQADREAMHLVMAAALRSAHTKYSTNDSLARRYTVEILPLIGRSASAQTVAYLNGQVPITTVLDARRMELMKQEDYFMVLMERQMALAEIEMMVGSRLE